MSATPDLRAPPASLAAALDEIAAGADERDARPSYPGDAFERLAAAGALALNLPAHDAEDQRPSFAEELATVRAVARADGSVGRIYDGHVNAVERLALLAPEPLRAGELARVAAGELTLGVWGADPVPAEGEPARLDRSGERLHGVKVFCSGAGGVDRALVNVRRIGAVHAVANTAALLLYVGSLRARRRGRHGRGVALGLMGVGALAAGGHLGGHLSYDKGVGVNQTFDALPEESTSTVPEDEVREGEATRASAGDVAILLSRHEGRVYALADRCTHRGGSLADGPLADGCVTCPLHGSIFRLADGAVVRGPAGAPEPAFAVRIEDGTVDVRAVA